MVPILKLIQVWKSHILKTMKQSFIFSRKDCQVQKVHLFEEHQRQWEVEGGNFAEVFKKFQYWWIPGAKEVKYYHKCPAISSSRLTFLMGFSLCFKPFWERSFLSRKLKHNWFKNFNWPKVSDNRTMFENYSNCRNFYVSILAFPACLTASFRF